MRMYPAVFTFARVYTPHEWQNKHPSCPIYLTSKCALPTHKYRTISDTLCIHPNLAAVSFLAALCSGCRKSLYFHSGLMAKNLYSPANQQRTQKRNPPKEDSSDSKQDCFGGSNVNLQGGQIQYRKRYRRAIRACA